MFRKVRKMMADPAKHVTFSLVLNKTDNQITHDVISCNNIQYSIL